MRGFLVVLAVAGAAAAVAAAGQWRFHEAMEPQQGSTVGQVFETSDNWVSVKSFYQSSDAVSIRFYPRLVETPEGDLVEDPTAIEAIHLLKSGDVVQVRWVHEDGEKRIHRITLGKLPQ